MNGRRERKEVRQKKGRWRTRKGGIGRKERDDEKEGSEGKEGYDRKEGY